MPRFFITDIQAPLLEISGEDAKHIALSLRMKTGQTLTLCDGMGREALCELTEITPERVSARVLERRASASEPSCRITLYQALPKGDKLEMIVQKAVELGAFHIVPVLTARCVSRPDERSMEKKRGRLQKIADEAAKQSGRGALPQVAELMSFKDAVLEMKRADLPLFFFEHGTVPLSTAMEAGAAGDIAVMIGAEGGFDESEAAYALENGMKGISLGPRILRCETAPLAALSAILYATGNME